MLRKPGMVHAGNQAGVEILCEHIIDPLVYELIQALTWSSSKRNRHALVIDLGIDVPMPPTVIMRLRHEYHRLAGLERRKSLVPPVRGELTGQIAVVVLRVQNVFVRSFSDYHGILLSSLVMNPARFNVNFFSGQRLARHQFRISFSLASVSGFILNNP